MVDGAESLREVGEDEDEVTEEEDEEGLRPVIVSQNDMMKNTTGEKEGEGKKSD